MQFLHTILRWVRWRGHIVTSSSLVPFYPVKTRFALRALTLVCDLLAYYHNGFIYLNTESHSSKMLFLAAVSILIGLSSMLKFLLKTETLGA